LPAKTKPCWFLVSAMPTPLKKSRRNVGYEICRDGLARKRFYAAIYK
jgi:hypothetical protein